MLLCNNVSRFDVAIAAVRGGATKNPKVQVVAHQLIAGLKHEHQKAAEYARANGIGMYISCHQIEWDTYDLSFRSSGDLRHSRLPLNFSIQMFLGRFEPVYLEDLLHLHRGSDKSGHSCIILVLLKIHL